jgi:hypothetical protein
LIISSQITAHSRESFESSVFILALQDDAFCINSWSEEAQIRDVKSAVHHHLVRLLVCGSSHFFPRRIAGG